MTPERIAELREILRNATPGPWRYCDSHGANVSTTDGDMIADLDPASTEPPWEGRPADGLLIAAARSALPEALDECEQLTINVGLHKTREQQATEACAALTMENQRLRDLAALTKYVDDEIDGVLEDAEEAEVSLAQAQSDAKSLRAQLEKVRRDRDAMIETHDEVEADRDSLRSQLATARAECDALNADLAQKQITCDALADLNDLNVAEAVEAIAAWVEQSAVRQSPHRDVRSVAADIRSGAWRSKP